MQAAVCSEYGPPELLRIEEVPRPEPGPGEVLVRISAAAVNFPDVLLLANLYQISVPLPFIPGSEFAGEVAGLGDGVDSFALGERVFGAVMVVAFAQYVVVPAAGLMRAPAGVDLAVLAGFWVAHATAYHALRSVAEVQPGEWVVVLGAAGGVGLAAVELAQVLGARVIAAASSAEKLELCRQRGAEHGVNYLTEDLRDGIRAAAPAGADVVIDPVGGPNAERALRATRYGSRFVTVGFASGEIPRIPLNLVLLKGVSIKGFEMRTFGENDSVRAERDRSELLALLAEGRIAPHVSSTHPLAQAATALRLVAERRSEGKVLITID
ncbi:MAG: NADPH:quinone oxidoreductase family protein [Acidimicrobiia bacterium]|nr:NADPH:quinone oxidoreductase family protein [Acidimicrobiia bacterium]